MKILALDIETSGLNPDTHAPVQIGLAVMLGDEVIATYETILGEFPKREYSVKALSISGITWKQIQAGVPVVDVFKDLERWIAENEACELPIVSHNAKFDQVFWDVLALSCGAWVGKWPDKKFVKEKELLRGPWICTMRMADPLRSERSLIPDCKLDSVAAHFGLSRSTDIHGSLEDAVLAGKIYHRLAHQVSKAAA